MVAGVEQFGVVLHEALEAGGRLELGLGGVRVLGVDELVDESLGALEDPDVGVHFDGEAVGVSGEGAEAVPVHRLAARLLEESLQLVVLHVDRQQLLRLPVHEGSDGAHCLAGLAGHCQAVEVEVPLRRNAQQEREAAQGEGIGVLEDDDPLATLCQPFLGRAVHLQQSVHVAVPVRLRLDLQLPRNHAEPALVVHHRGHFFLIEDGDLLLAESEVFAGLEELEGLGVRVFRGHDDERNGFAIAVFSLEGVDVLAVVLQEAFFGEKLFGNGDLNALVAQALAQTSSHQHEGSSLELPHADCFVLLPSLEVAVGNGDALGLAHLVVFVGIHAEGGFLEQSDSILVVGLESSGVGGLNFGDLGIESLLLLLGGREIGVSDVFLADAFEKLNVHTNKTIIILS